MENLSRLKPQLRPHRITHDGTRLIVEDSEHTRTVSLPFDCEAIVALLDGTRTVKEIVERLVSTLGIVNFRSLLTTLQALDEAELFRKPLGLKQEQAAVAPSERPEAFFMRPLFEVTIARRVRLAFLANPIFLLAATAAIVVIAVDTCLYWMNHFSAHSFFLLRDFDGHLSYARAIPAIVVMTSGLMICKGLVKTVLLLLGTGQFFNLKLRLHPFGFSLGVSDVSTHSMGRLRVLLYFLGMSFTYIAIAAVLPSYVQEPETVHTFETLALLLTLLELDPYRRSDLTLLIDRFFRDGDSRRMVAYLKNRALFSAASTSKGFGGEARLVAYSSLALLWTVAFAIFALDLLSSNYPSLVLNVILSGPLIERVGAAVLLAILAAVFGTLLFDLVSTVGRNILFPLLKPYLRFFQKYHTKDIIDFDREVMAKSLLQTHFFEDLAPLSVREMVAKAHVKTFRHGTRLIIQGEVGHELFVLLEGSVEVVRRDETGLQTRLSTLGPGAVFGEVALVRDCLRTADVVAVDDIKTLVVERQAFRRLVEGSKYLDDFERVIDKIALGHYLSSVPLFRDMPTETLGKFREKGRFERHGKGDVVIKEGDTDRSFFLVLRGSVDVNKRGQGVATLKQGDFFGEIALLSAVPRTATVKCLEETLLLRLESDAFWEALSGNIALAAGLEIVAEQRQTVKQGS